MSNPVHHVGLGMTRAIASPGRLRAIVGPGFLLSLVDTDGRAAAMTHIPNERLSTSRGAEIEDYVGKCLTALKKAGGRIRRARVELVGGADILGVFPRGQRQASIDALVGSIEGALAEHRLSVARTRTGGSVARRVELTLPDQRLEIDWVNKKRRHLPPNPEVPESPPPARRYEDEIIVNMGCLEVARPPKQLVAVLGSCVGVALFDPSTGIGGLAHVMLAERNGRNGGDAKYGDTAVGALRAALERSGADGSALIAKIAGGATVLSQTKPNSLLAVGRDNVASVRASLTEAGIRLAWEDVGGDCGRRMTVDLADFGIQVRRLERVRGIE